jgi:type IV secretion system protein VirB9
VRGGVAAAFLLALAATRAAAQVQPAPGEGDPRIQAVDFVAGQVVQLRGSPGYELMIELSPDEQIQNVALGDSASWQVSVNKQGDRLFLKPAQADASTNMTVVTSVRVYNFDLAALSFPSAQMPYTVQFHYPAPAARPANPEYVDVASATRRLSRYRFGGDRQLWPSSVSNDGQHTFIAWPKAADVPAVYAPDQSGREALVNGMMGTDDVYVVDGVPPQLTFRIDGNVAWAKRVKPRKGR